VRPWLKGTYVPRRCLADISGPFYVPTKPFRNWSALPFYQLDLPRPPYVDLDQLAWAHPPRNRAPGAAPHRATLAL
jgi:hypothetical protein